MQKSHRNYWLYYIYVLQYLLWSFQLGRNYNYNAGKIKSAFIIPPLCNYCILLTLNVVTWGWGLCSQFNLVYEMNMLIQYFQALQVCHVYDTQYTLTTVAVKTSFDWKCTFTATVLLAGMFHLAAVLWIICLLYFKTIDFIYLLIGYYDTSLMGEDRRSFFYR